MDMLSSTLRIAMLLDHPGHYDSRVAREALALTDVGHDVRVFAIHRSAGGAASGRTRDGLADGVTYVPCLLDESRTVPVLSALARRLGPERSRAASLTSETPKPDLAPSLPSSQPTALHGLKRRLGEVFAPRAILRAVGPAVGAFRPDIVHAHDLSMLPTGAALAGRLGAKLIYDAHEYERGRNVALRPAMPRLAARREARHARRADAVITVGDTIADALAEELGVSRPYVVLNSEPGLADPIGMTRSGKTPGLADRLGLPADTVTAIYTGRLGAGRGVGRVLDALEDLDGVHLAVLAPEDGRSRDYLSACLRGREGVAGRVHVLPGCGPMEVVATMAGATLALMPLDDAGLSHSWALPNKLFQSVAAGVPVVSTPLRDITAFLELTRTGVVSRDFTPASFADAVRAALSSAFQPDVAQLAPYDWAAQARLLCAVTAAVGAGAPLPTPIPLPHAVHTRASRRA